MPATSRRDRDADRRRHAAAPIRWSDRIAGIRVRTLVLGAVGAVLVLGLILALSLVRPDRTHTEAAAGDSAAPSAPPSAPAVPNPQGSPQPGPQPGSPPVASAQAQAAPGVNAQALLDEMRKHDPTLSDADGAKLVAIGDANLARNQPDLTATDPQIRAAVDEQFPQVPPEQRATMVRCIAEYAERVWAMNNHTSPPDADDHTGG